MQSSGELNFYFWSDSIPTRQERYCSTIEWKWLLLLSVDIARGWVLKNIFEKRPLYYLKSFISEYQLSKVFLKGAYYHICSHVKKVRMNSH